MEHPHGRVIKSTLRGAGVVIQTPEGDKIECLIRLDFPTTNNEAEYEALVAGLDLARAAGAENIIMHCDSQVITSRSTTIMRVETRE